MSTLGRSQSDWRKLFRELGLFLAPQKELRELARRFDLGSTRVRVLETGDVNETTAGWRLTGVRIGGNTDESGTLCVRLAFGVPAVGQAQLSLYKAPGGGAQDLVAQGVGAPGTSVALASQNGSGVAGVASLGPVAASELDDKKQLVLFPDWAARMHALFDGSEPEHGDLLEAFMSALQAASKAVAQSLAAFETATDTFLATRWKNFQRSSASSPIQKATQDDRGAISVQVSGLLEDGRDNMADEAPAKQSVPRTVVVTTAAAFDGTNKGRGVLAAPLMAEWARSGRITALCVDAALGAERFSLSQHQDETGEDRAAANELQVRRGYADPDLGIKGAFLARVVTLDQGTPDDFGPVAGWTVLGESAGNTDQGRIALKVVAQGALFTIEGYTSQTLDPTTRVFTTAPGAQGASVAILAANGSGLSGSVVLGGKPTDGHTGLLNLNPFATGDKFVIDVSLASRGEFQEALALLYGYALESDDPAKATLDDRFLSAGTLPPFEDVS